MTEPHGAPPQPTLRAVALPLASMLVIQALISMAALTVPVFAVKAAADIGIPARWVGAYVSLIYVSAMFTSVLGGLFVLRFGAVRVSQLCLCIAAAGLCLTTTAWLPLVALGALVMGIGYGPPTPASSHVLARHTPRRFMPLVFSVKQTGVPLGGALAGALVPTLVLAYGWRGASLAAAALCVATAIFLQPLRAGLDADRDRRRRLGGNPLFPLRWVLADRVLRRLAFLSFLYSAVQMCLTAYLVTYLVEAVNLDLVGAGIVFAVAQTAGVLGRILWGAVSDVLITARQMLALLGVMMAAAALAMASFAPGWSLAAILAVSVIFGTTAIGWNGIYLAEFARLAPPGQAGVLTGGALFITFAGVVVAPPLFGAWVAFSGSYGSGFVALAALALAGAALMAWTGAAEDRARAP
ncbi:MAG: MFS transporter [Alphaproteobacteria bacterium]